MIWLHLRRPLFPYTTLFRSQNEKNLLRLGFERAAKPGEFHAQAAWEDMAHDARGLQRLVAGPYAELEFGARGISVTSADIHPADAQHRDFAGQRAADSLARE